MKIKKKIKNYNKLLKLKLIQTKIYKKNQIIKHSSIENIEHRLKKSLQIIHKYNINKKKILFIINPSILTNIKTNILKKTKHLFITQNFWLNGKLTNKQQFYKKNISQYKTKKLKNKNDLIIILDKLTNNNIIKESYKTKTPIIFLNNNSEIFNFKLTYKVPGNFLLNKKKTKNFFLTLLKIIFQKKKRTKPLYKKFIQAFKNKS